MKRKHTTRTVLVAGKHEENLPRFKFLKLQAEEVLSFMNSTQAGTSRDLLVYMLVLNAERVTKLQTVKFTRRWRTGLPLDRKTIYRCLKRLHQAGLIHAEFQRGKSAVVTITRPAKTENAVSPSQDEPE